MKKVLIMGLAMFTLLSVSLFAEESDIADSSDNVTGSKLGNTDVSATLKNNTNRKIVSAKASGYDGKDAEYNNSSARTKDVDGNTKVFISFTVTVSGNIETTGGSGGGAEIYSATRTKKGEFYVDPLEKIIAKGETAKFTARRISDENPISVEWKITTKNGTQVQPDSGTTTGTDITTLATLAANEYIVTAKEASDKTATGTLVISGIIFQKKSAGESTFSDISSGADLFISAGNATQQPEFPTIRAKYTGTLTLYRSLQYGVQKGRLNVIAQRNEKNYGTIKGTDDTKEILAGVANNGGVIRSFNNQEFGLIVKYKFDGNNEEEEIKFNLKGNNPSISSVKSFIDAKSNLLTVTYNTQRTDMTTYYKKIITHESSFKQFNSSGTYSGEPNYGAPNGWGIAQIDKGAGSYNTNYMWNWHANLNEGISTFTGKVGGINDRIRWIGNEYPNLPSLTNEQFIRAMIIAYNGFSGTNQVRTGYDDRGNPTYISFCYKPTLGNQWGNFKDNVNNYYSIIANTMVP